MANTLGDYIAEIKTPIQIRQLLQSRTWVNPPSTSSIHLRTYEPIQDVVGGYVIEEDGDVHNFKQRSLKEVLGFFDASTLVENPSVRTQRHITSNPNAVVDIGD